MIGAKSDGCAPCKRRKIKCNEKFPVCRNCERGGRDCPSPKSRFIRFIKPGREMHIEERVTTKFPMVIASSTSQSLAIELVDRFASVKDISYQLQNLAAFFDLLLTHIGHNAALDAAVKCMLDKHRIILTQKIPPVDTDLRYYDRAVALLRRDLTVFGSETPPETVCAAHLLLCYEGFRGDARITWMSHAGGAAALLEAWGPQRFNSQFKRAILMSNHGAIIASCIFARKECFLNSPKWEEVRLAWLRFHTSEDEKYYRDILAALAWLPNLLKHIRDYAPDYVDSKRALVHKAREFKTKVSQHAAKLQSNLQNPSKVFKIQLSPRQVGHIYNLYWTATIIANSILAGFGDPNNTLTLESKFAAEQIVKSINFFQGLKPLGIFIMTWSLAAAYGVLSRERRSILVKMNWLLKFIQAE
ncbi:hypothetical protein N431DRAFT_499171 [Stipitochalara longipes BDJ]|nr:hypothetical protein N431DRAFT_499171 [Stipitochalara longipes BDJ]